MTITHEIMNWIKNILLFKQKSKNSKKENGWNRAIGTKLVDSSKIQQVSWLKIQKENGWNRKIGTHLLTAPIYSR
jgi:hypothetical protein